MARCRVLFVCIGNSCRSQMAEGFARTYGSDVLEPYSAGLSPTTMVAPLTRKVMREKNIDLSGSYPKSLGAVPEDVDYIVNMSGHKAPYRSGATVEEWKVLDPIGMNEEVFRQVANEIELRVMRLILTLRAKQSGEATRPGSGARRD
jgi:arsenate reductase